MHPEQHPPLRAIRLFADLPDDALGDIARRCGWREYAPGEQILDHLDPSRDVFLIAKGSVRVVNHALSGKEVSYREIDAGEIFGEFAAIDGQPRSASVVALSDCLVAALSERDFWAAIKAHPALADALLKHLTRLVRLYSERVQLIATLPVALRVQVELLKLARGGRREGAVATIEPAPTHEELASRIGTHREAVTRELAALRREGILRPGRRRLIVADYDRLEEMVHRAVGESLIE